MGHTRTVTRRLRRAALAATAAAAPAALLCPVASAAGALTPGNLLVSTSVFTDTPAITAGVTQLPPNCSTTTGAPNPCVTAVAGAQYPYVFNNDNVDGSFGITEPIVLDQIAPVTTLTTPISQTTVPNSDTTTGDQMVTSFSSKSEIGLNDALDGNSVTFMGYGAPTAALDISNSSTPGAPDANNSDSATPTYRVVAQLKADGSMGFTETNAYNGNNGRAAVLDPSTNTLYMAGNAGNTAKGHTSSSGVVLGTGAQYTQLSTQPESAQNPGLPTPVGNFNITETGATPDKAAKDNNYRGIAAYNGVLYFTKGSGGNGINTLYFVDTTGTACPTGSGLPASGVRLPTTSSISYSTSNSSLGLTTANPGLQPTNMCVLQGFPTTLASASSGLNYPFGIWFANPTTLYVADEGSGAGGASDSTGGLEKWTFNSATGSWQLAYTIQAGLGLQQPYTVAPSASGQTYPTGLNNTQGGKGGNWAPATDGLRNIAGQVNADGTVTVWATTSTISGSGDQGADPNEVVAVTDPVAATSLPSTDAFSTVLPATDGTVYRGVAFTPGTNNGPPTNLPEVPWGPLLPAAAVTIGGGLLWRRHRAGPANAAQ